MIFFFRFSCPTDFFELSPKEVLKFCEECVLSEEEEPCEVPESVYGKYIDGLHP